MLPTDLLIDGYNLLHAAGLGRSRYARGDLQRARQSLLRRLFQLLTPEEVARTAVVFDARHPPPHLPPNWLIHGMRVVYARPHGDADLILEELIDGHSAPQRLTVVSSDHRLHRAAKRRRASAVDSDEFLEFLERRHPSAAIEIPAPKPTISTPDVPEGVAAAELAYWLSIFGDVKVSELIDPPRPTLPGSPPSSQPAPPSTPSTRPRSSRVAAKKPATPDSSQPKPGIPKPAPELFSAEWIAELQRWVDEQR